jgi:type IV fimbrial biogenesis protein FimT
MYIWRNRVVMKSPLLKSSRGLTLVELIIVVAIVGILAGAAGPGFGNFLAEKTVTSETRRIIGALKLARSEARARGATVTLARDSGQDWSGPIDIYTDTTSANHPMNGTDDLVRREESSGRSINAIDNQNTGDEWISFNMRGWLAETGPVLIALCAPGRDASRGMYIEINRVGKIRERRIGTDARGCNP